MGSYQLGRPRGASSTAALSLPGSQGWCLCRRSDSPACAPMSRCRVLHAGRCSRSSPPPIKDVGGCAQRRRPRATPGSERRRGPRSGSPARALPTADIQQICRLPTADVARRVRQEEWGRVARRDPWQTRAWHRRLTGLLDGCQGGLTQPLADVARRATGLLDGCQAATPTAPRR